VNLPKHIDVPIENHIRVFDKIAIPEPGMSQVEFIAMLLGGGVSSDTFHAINMIVWAVEPLDAKTLRVFVRPE